MSGYWPVVINDDYSPGIRSCKKSTARVPEEASPCSFMGKRDECLDKAYATELQP